MKNIKYIFLIVFGIFLTTTIFGSTILSDSAKHSNYYYLGSFSVSGWVGGGIRYMPISHFSTDFELGLVPFEGGGGLANLSLNYHFNNNSGFITGITYSKVFFGMSEGQFASPGNDQNVLSPWTGYLFRSFLGSSLFNCTLRLGGVYSFYEKKFEAPYFYVGIGLPFNKLNHILD